MLDGFMPFGKSGGTEKGWSSVRVPVISVSYSDTFKTFSYIKWKKKNRPSNSSTENKRSTDYTPASSEDK
jgi:hypothetical protein